MMTAEYAVNVTKLDREATRKRIRREHEFGTVFHAAFKRL